MTSDSSRRARPDEHGCALEVRRGRELYENGQYDEARQAFERAIDIQSDSLEAAAGLAKVLIVEGAYADAKDLYEAALNKGLEKSAEHLTNLAICYAFDGEREPARTLMEGAIAVNPLYEPAYGALARHCLIMGDYVAAERYASEGLRLFARNVPCFEARALARLSMLNLQGAEADAHALLELDPESVDGLLCKASVLVARGKASEALAILQRARTIDPQNAEVMLAQGAAHQLKNEAGAAESLYRQAQELEPQNWRIYQSLASLELFVGRNAQGLEDVETALELHDAPSLHYLRGEFLTRLGRSAESQQEFAHATRDNPIDALSWIGLAELEAQEPAARDIAKSHAEMAHALDPTGPAGERARELLRKLLT